LQVRALDGLVVAAADNRRPVRSESDRRHVRVVARYAAARVNLSLIKYAAIFANTARHPNDAPVNNQPPDLAGFGVIPERFAATPTPRAAARLVLNRARALRANAAGVAIPTGNSRYRSATSRARKPSSKPKADCPSGNVSE